MWSTPAHVHDLSDEEHFTAEHLLHYFLEARGAAIPDIGVRDVVIGTFVRTTWKHMVSLAEASPAPHWIYSHEVTPLFHGSAAGRPVSLVQFPMGAPAAVMVMELLIACGARRFLVLGAAGSLQEDVPIGSLVVPDACVREDGTSFHYLPPDATPRPDPHLAELVRAACRERGVEPAGGVNWSTDAIFRELKKKVVHYRDEGVTCVEMEAAALFAVGALRDVGVALVLAISDELFRPWAPAFLHDAYRERLRLAQDALLAAAARLPVREP